jgi:predicted dehydrogenase
MAKTELRIGVIGYGGRGRRLAQIAHRPDAGIRVIAAADERSNARDRFRQTYGEDATVVADAADLMAVPGIDAVIIASPDAQHETQAITALSAGCAVYLEKPMAITTAGCDRILAATRSSGSRLYVGHNMRHFAVVRTMKDLIRKGAIGEVTACWCRHFVGHGGDYYFKDWHSDRREVTSLLLQKGCHDIDIIHWLCGGYSRRVSAMGGLTVYGRAAGRRQPGEPPPVPLYSLDHWPPLSQTDLSPLIDVEDLSMVHMALDNGTFASYEQCHYTPDYWRNYTVIGTEGRVENFGSDQADAEVRLWNRRTAGFNPAGDHVFPTPSTATDDHGGADTHTMNEFLDFVRDGSRSTDASPIAARWSVAVGCSATESLRTGGAALTVSPPPSDIVDYFGGT